MLRLDEARRVLLGAAADLADHDAPPRSPGRCSNSASTSMKSMPLDRIAADADARRLAEPERRELARRLVGQRARARDDADVPGLVDVARHDADLALARRDDARAVRADQLHRRRRVRAERAPHLDHVQHRDALGDADDELDARVDRLEDRVGRAGRRHEDHRRVGAGLLHRLRRRCRTRGKPFVHLAALAGRDAGDDLGAVLAHLLGVERPGAAGDALDDELGLLADEDAMATSPLRRARAPRSSARRRPCRRRW